MLFDESFKRKIDGSDFNVLRDDDDDGGWGDDEDYGQEEEEDQEDYNSARGFSTERNLL